MSLFDQFKITGKVVDNDSKEAVMQSTVQLLRSDSTFISGALTDAAVLPLLRSGVLKNARLVVQDPMCTRIGLLI